MDRRTVSQPKWQVLQTTASTYNAFQTEEQVKGLVGAEIYDFSTFIAKNRSNTDTNEIATLANGLQPINESLIFTLWDNLFYQVVTQKAFYIK